MDSPLPLILVVVVAAIAGWLSQRSRRKMDDYRRRLEQQGEYVPPPPQQRMTRAQRRVEEFRAAVPPPHAASIEEIARAEAEELGLDQIPGGEALPVSVQLLVWRRDADIYDRCEGGAVRYELTAGVVAAEATVDDVKLVCDGDLRPPGEILGNNSGD